jgi:hypothetical protein
MAPSSVTKRVAKILGVLVAGLALLVLKRRAESARHDLSGDAHEPLPAESAAHDLPGDANEPLPGDESGPAPR